MRPPTSTTSLERHKSPTDQRRHLRSDGSVTSMITRSVSGSSYWKPIRKARTGRDVEQFKKEVDIDDHTLDYEDFLDRYQTNMTDGLSQSKADELLTLNGPNCLVPTEGTNTWKIFCMHLFGGFNVMIWLGSVLTFIEFGIKYFNTKLIEVEVIALAVVLALTALISGVFAFFHERKHTEIMDSFSKMIPKFASVVRDGRKIIVPSEELVEGDLVEINSGNMIPADMRIMESLNLKVDNSAITGESVAQVRSPDLSDNNPLETQNLAFYGTSVIEGTGLGIVIRCGHDTVLGHIAGLTSAVEKGETLLRKELNIFVKILSIIAFVIAICLFGLCMGLGYGFFYSFTFFIAIMVANVPEGLPVAFTTCMALTAKRMAEKNCLVKKFESIETLGSCNVICSDKTGTLTQNKMVASHLYFDGIEYDVLSNLESVNVDSDAYKALCTVAVLCSRASFIISNDSEKKEISGDASEIAIMRIMDILVGDIEALRADCPKVCEIPFTSATKFQLSIHRLPTKKFVMVMKGAPEKVLEHCATILREGETLPLNTNTLKPIKRSIINLGRKGERVLAFADMYLSDKYHPRYAFNAEKINFSITGLRFVGMISLIDPPKASVPEAVSKCKTAGIRVIMVTGDHPITASAIARKVGIISTNATSIFDESIRHDVSVSIISITNREKPHTAAILTGTDLNTMSEKDLQQVLLKHREIVFARTSPQQKLKIVEALQHLNFVVAVTGDGVNDSPALKKGDIGIAMGITGSDVSKEAADMILLDDNFASIVTGIEEGRLIFDNLKKSICYELTSNVPEIVPFVMMIALNIPRALSVMAILVIDVGTDLWAAISLVYEKAEADIMKRHPRNPKRDRLINKRLIAISYLHIGVIQTAAAFTCYFWLMAEYGWHWDRLIGIRPEWESKEINDLEDSYGQEWPYEARQELTKKSVSAYFLSIVITQVADLISCKTRRLSVCRQGFGNHVLNAGLMFEVFLAGLIVYCPVINDAFHFSPIGVAAIIPAIPFAVFIFLYDETRKFFIRTYPNGFIAKETYY